MREIRQARLQYEIDLLNEASVRHDAPATLPLDGTISFRVWLPRGDDELELTVHFPDLFPYFRFEVMAPSLALDLHQHPYEKNLCLLGRGAGVRPSDTLLSFLQTRVPEVIEVASMTAEDSAGREEDQAEPVTEYYPYAPGSVLIDGGWRIPAGATHGVLDLAVESRRGAAEALVVVRVKDQRGRVLFEIDPAIAQLYPTSMHGQWMRRREHLLEPDASKYLAAIAKEQPHSLRTNTSAEREYAFYAVVAPEESGRRDRSGTGWVMVRLHRPKRPGSTKGRPWTVSFVRCDRVGREDLQRRVPELRSLGASKVVVLGLGSLGGPTALSLAQAGVGELRIIDHDRVDPATSVRFPFGVGAAGKSKVNALHDFIRENYPYTAVRPEPRRIGTVAPGMRDLSFLEELTADADLLIDATGDLTVEYFSSSFAASKGLPYLMVSGTQGGWGGLVFRTQPGVADACWSCFQASLTHNAIPNPPASTAQLVQPLGCGDPTFTGAGFDMHSIALTAVRASVEMLSPDYPRAPWEGLVIAFRDDNSAAVAPTFTPWRAETHPECPACSDVRPSG